MLQAANMHSRHMGNGPTTTQTSPRLVPCQSDTSTTEKHWRQCTLRPADAASVLPMMKALLVAAWMHTRQMAGQATTTDLMLGG